MISRVQELFREYLVSLQILPSSYPWLLPVSADLTIEKLDALASTGDFPSLPDLADALGYCIYLSLIRYILQGVLKPLAMYSLQLKRTPQTKIHHIEAYAKRPVKLTNEEIANIAGATNLSAELVREYLWVGRRNRAVDFKVSKFVEATWRFMFYLAFCIIGFKALFIPETASWIKDSSNLWRDWPFHPITSDIRRYYHLELGAYMHQLLWTEVSRSDAFEMTLHHIVTMALLCTSYLTNFTRIGTYILLVHDMADIFLEVGKVFNYIQRAGSKWASVITDGFFGAFAITFFLSRLVVYPRYLLHGFVAGAFQNFGLWPGYYFYATLLSVLQCLHLFWFYLICKMLYRLFLTGVIEKDARSDDDDDDDVANKSEKKDA